MIYKRVFAYEHMRTQRQGFAQKWLFIGANRKQQMLYIVRVMAAISAEHQRDSNCATGRDDLITFRKKLINQTEVATIFSLNHFRWTNGRILVRPNEQ